MSLLKIAVGNLPSSQRWRSHFPVAARLQTVKKTTSGYVSYALHYAEYPRHPGQYSGLIHSGLRLKDSGLIDSRTLVLSTGLIDSRTLVLSTLVLSTQGLWSYPLLLVCKWFLQKKPDCCRLKWRDLWIKFHRLRHVNYNYLCDSN